MSQVVSYIDHKLKSHTPILGIKLWIVIVIVVCIVALIALSLVLLCFCFPRRRRKSNKVRLTTLDPIRLRNYNHNNLSTASSLDKRLLSRNGREIEVSSDTHETQASGTQQSRGLTSSKSVASDGKRVNQCYTLREIEAATNGLADVNVIGNGDYGIVYHGVLFNGTRVAIKKLLYDSGKTEDFIARVGAIGQARHRNLVKLLGYCTEGPFRMLVYEYVDNGNLSQWLHGCISQLSPLTWNIRMNIMQLAAKGLAYIHEDIEPKVVHQHIKSSNILLDHQWNPKISDLGIGDVLGPEWNRIAVVTSSFGKSSYVAPEYAYTGVFNEKSDVYSFGIVLMEIITGRTPVEYSTESKSEVCLIDWLKSMVATQSFENVVDSKMPEMPPLNELKRAVLLALRCADADVENRPRMGDVIQMFEPRDLLLSDGYCTRHKTYGCDSLKDNQAVNEGEAEASAIRTREEHVHNKFNIGDH